MHRLYGERKRRLFGALPGTVVELGAGTGANFRYYPPATRVLAVEPDTAKHPALTRHARRHALQLEIVAAGAETLPWADASVDLVVGTLVLCTVDDPAAVVGEIVRVLRPGGRFVFVEHVAASPASGLRRLQDLLERPWCRLFGGCRPNRETWRLLESAGFAQLQLERFRIGWALLPVRPHVAGVALR